MGDVVATWKRLETFWKHSDCDLRFKLVVYDAVIRAKLMYGLESVQLNQEERNKIDRFQLRGLRQILKHKTTYGQMLSNLARSNDNETVFRLANAKKNARRCLGEGFQEKTT